jgi:hypothetical protein
MLLRCVAWRGVFFWVGDVCVCLCVRFGLWRVERLACGG